jgi:hypothetical protein
MTATIKSLTLGGVFHEDNRSPSFRYFSDKLLALADS